MSELVHAVDGDIIAYKTAAVCDTHYEGACNSIIDSTLREIATESKVHQMRIYISDETNFRYRVAKTKPYKGNRATMTRPQFLDHCKQYLIDNYQALIVHDHEADDAIATDMIVNGASHCGIDKDMLQIPGRHYNYIKKIWIDVTPDEAEMTLWRQVLMGDVSDNVPGLPRVGEGKAFDTIQSALTAQQDAMAMYQSVVRSKMPGIDPIVYMAEQLQLIQMKTNVDLHFKNTVTIKPDTAGFVAQEEGVVNFETPAKIAGL